MAATLPAAWSSGTTYSYWDMVLGSDFNYYRSITNSNIGNNPTSDNYGVPVAGSSEGTHWVKWSQNSATPLFCPPLWDTSLSYTPATGFCVISPLDGFVYKCLHATTGGAGALDPSLDTTNWSKTTAFATANITNPLSQRKFTGFTNARWKMKAAWGTNTLPGDISDLAAVTATVTSSSVGFYFTPATNASQHQYRLRTPSGSGTFGAATALMEGTIATGLSTFTNYGVEVRGKNVSGVGNWSNELSVTTL